MPGGFKNGGSQSRRFARCAIEAETARRHVMQAKKFLGQISDLSMHSQDMYLEKLRCTVRDVGGKG